MSRYFRRFCLSLSLARGCPASAFLLLSCTFLISSSCIVCSLHLSPQPVIALDPPSYPLCLTLLHTPTRSFLLETSADLRCLPSVTPFHTILAITMYLNLCRCSSVIHTPLKLICVVRVVCHGFCKSTLLPDMDMKAPKNYRERCGAGYSSRKLRQRICALIQR